LLCSLGPHEHEKIPPKIVRQRTKNISFPLEYIRFALYKEDSTRYMHD
jgi:hypothetical protein